LSRKIAPSFPSSRTPARGRRRSCRLTWDDVGAQAIRYIDTKRHRTRHTPLLKPLADDLKEWFLASGRPTGKLPVFPAHDGGFWQQDAAIGRTRILPSPGRRRQPRARVISAQAT
jgi:integrase